jgi:hypothetical protein
MFMQRANSDDDTLILEESSQLCEEIKWMMDIELALPYAAGMLWIMSPIQKG